ncbi:SlyX family protein [Sneathiella glossodoripedis]|uniref:SlyX family protein n=1 Tax=Sneathiella glossodoripedis TaxID=418853 RepID=UPI0004721AD0|nr:SlyX family protein [Sneathiella glossodoripedis]
MTETEFDKRLTALELKLMDQDQMITDLSDMVNRQWQEIESLQAKLKTAHSRIVSLEDSLPAPGASAEKPPHY